MTNKVLKTIVRRDKKFDEEYSDMTHVGCSNTSIPCGTMRMDVKSHTSTTLKEVLEAVEMEIDNQNIRVLATDYQIGHDKALEKVSTLLRETINELSKTK